jgi:hypothetical protein
MSPAVATQTRAIEGLADDFELDQRPGTVIGSTTPSGHVRRGIDAEGVISIDGGALRIGMLTRPGWARAGLAYGPFERRPGLALAALVLNGHNTSRSYVMSDPHRRIARWVLGAPGTDPPWLRFIRWPWRQRNGSALAQLARWLHSRPRAKPLPSITDNLAVGWFPDEVPADPASRGHSLIMSAAVHENGELRSRSASTAFTISRNIQNLPIHYITVLREQGATHYAASLPNAHALGGYPYMRPLAIDPVSDGDRVWAGVYQSVLGEIGFSVDSRIFGVRIAEVTGHTQWYGLAHAADTLCGEGPLESAEAAIGGPWRVVQGSLERTTNGARTGAGAAQSLAVLNPSAATGLIHAFVQTEPGAPPAGLVWRYRDPDNFWCVTISDRAELKLKEAGSWIALAAADLPRVDAGVGSLQVIDDGRVSSVALNGHALFQPCADPRLADHGGAGIYAAAPDDRVRFRSLEAHPRQVPIPPELDLGPTWCATGDRVAVSDGFRGIAPDLAGRATPQGGIWRRELGPGVIELTGDAARVCASAERPNPGRTTYTHPWPAPDFADLEVEMTPPGTDWGQGHNGRGGLIFWQDRRNYIILNLYLDNTNPATAFSSFFHLSGHENLYDAVWTNIGNRVTWGRRLRLRMTFDGLNYMVMLGDEPLLYRSLRDVYPKQERLAITRVGLCANWEFGNDTGTWFHSFTARTR